MPNLQFKYSIEDEVQRVQYTLKKISWYLENNYKVFFPKNLDLNGPQNVGAIADAVHAEYDEKMYKEQEAYIRAHWHEVENKSGVELKTLLPWLVTEYWVHLTRYGVGGGSYHFPNFIVVNRHMLDSASALQRVLHEMTHLGIHPAIQKHNISHWVKERLVDNLTMKINPKYGRLRKIPDNFDVHDIDAIFNAHYPNTENIILSLRRELA